MKSKSGFDLHALEVFAAVCHTRSMTDAAKQVHLTQPAVSHTVRRLEKPLGVTLIDRNRRPVTLTLSGRIFQQKAEEILHEIYQIPNLLRGSSIEALGQLRIGMVDSLAKLVVPHVVKSTLNSLPSLSIWAGWRYDHRRLFLDRELDIVIASDLLDDVDGLERHTLLTEPFVLLLPIGISESAEPIELRTLAKQLPLIRAGRNSNVGIQTEQHLRRIRLEVPRRFEFDALETVVAAVAGGLGWALLPPTSIIMNRHELRNVLVAQLSGPGYTRRLTLIARADELGTLPHAIGRAIRDLLRRKHLPDLYERIPWLKGQVTLGL